ncbi:MAG: Sulphatase-modifying factor protein [Flavipsychrobacter sp.]|nr:Sulphatase-modifying factor protein [Flavipsychrobacter sp.]
MKCVLSSLLMLCFLQPAMAQRKYYSTGNKPLDIYMSKVVGGTYTLGNDDEATDRRPAHNVTLKDFYIGTYEVTQEQWKLIMGSNPSSYICDECPVTNVSYNDALAFISKLNAKTGKSYRLPTEAEWEYAARGGSKEVLVRSYKNVAPGGVNNFLAPNGSRNVPDKEITGKKYSGKKLPQDVAWFERNSHDRIHPIGKKKPNEIGVFDMSGNVEEWCADFYATDYGSRNGITDPQGPSTGRSRVVRGGSWANTATEIVVTRRAAYLPDTRTNSLGFRLVSDK